MSLSIENDGALANGIEEVKVIAGFPDDFATEEDGKVEFQVFKNHPNCQKIFLDNEDLQASISLLEEFKEKRGQ